MLTKYLLILCLLVEACSVRLPNLGRGPSSSSLSTEDNLKNQIALMTAFQQKIMGESIDPKCTKEKKEEEFEKMMRSLKADSCSINNFTADRQAFENRICSWKKTDGYFDRVVKKIIADEKEEKPLVSFQDTVDDEFWSLYKEADGYLKIVDGISFDKNYSVEQRLDLVIQYIKNVLLPIRDLVVVKRAYVEQETDGSIYYENLRPSLPKSLTDNISNDQLVLLTSGPERYTDPFALILMDNGITKNNEETTLLTFDLNIVLRDVATLMKAPSLKNTVTALKWFTLNMMLSQISIADNFMGNTENIHVPKSCQNHLNGNMPEFFSQGIERDKNLDNTEMDKYLDDINIDKNLDNTMYKIGLKPNLDYIDSVGKMLDNFKRDPTKDGYSKVFPFLEYKNAKMGLNTSSFKIKMLGLNTSWYKNKMLVPELDDLAHFEKVSTYKINEIKMKVFKKSVKATVGDKKEKVEVNFLGLNMLEKIVKDYGPDATLSEYLFEVMKDKGVLKLEDILSVNLKNKLSTTKISIDFPSLYSSPLRKDWSLNILANIFNRYKDLPLNSDLHRLVAKTCLESNPTLFEKRNVCNGKNLVLNMANLLSEYQSKQTMVPLDRLAEKNLQVMFPLFNSLWILLRDTTDLMPEAKPNEYNFLMDEIKVFNPWARLKLSFMVAIDQMEKKTRRWYIPKEKPVCDHMNLDQTLSQFKMAMQILGLDKPLSYGHANRFLSVDEQEGIWKEILDKIDNVNAQFLSTKVGDSDNREFYELFEDLSYKTVLNLKTALSAGYKISAQAKKELKEFSESSEAVNGDFYLSLYKLKGDIKKHEELLDQQKFAYMTKFDVKKNFLKLDALYKEILYKDLLRQAAKVRKNVLMKKVDELCKIKINNFTTMRKVFYSTSKIQNQFNKNMGMPSLPESVLSKINDLSPEENRDMNLSYASLVTGIGALLAGGACTLITGPLCVPIAGGMMGGGLFTLGVQVFVTKNEYYRKIDSDVDANEVKEMEYLNFADSGSADEIQKSYFYTIFNAISIWPFIGLSVKPLIEGPKLIFTSLKPLYKNVTKAELKTAAKSILLEDGVRRSGFLVEMNTVSKNLGIDKKSRELFMNDIAKISQLHKMKQISAKEMISRKVTALIQRIKSASINTFKSELGKVAVKEPRDQIDQGIARLVANYFRDNPKDFLRLIDTYVAKLENAHQVMAKVNNQEIFRIPVFGSIRQWFLKLRHQALDKNADKILKIKKDLSLLADKPQVLETYVFKNMDDLTEIFLEMPFRKRELPYFMLIQGSPNMWMGKRLPVLSLMSEGQMMKDVFTARSILVHESYKNQARKILGLQQFVQSEATLTAFKAFQKSVFEISHKKGETEALNILKEYEVVEEKIVQKLYAHYSLSRRDLDYPAFKKVLFNFSSTKDRAFADAIWESVPASELMEVKDVGIYAYKAVKDLSLYDDVDSFQNYLNALKILILYKNPAVLNF